VWCQTVQCQSGGVASFLEGKKLLLSRSKKVPAAVNALNMAVWQTGFGALSLSAQKGKTYSWCLKGVVVLHLFLEFQKQKNCSSYNNQMWWWCHDIFCPYEKWSCCFLEGKVSCCFLEAKKLWFKQQSTCAVSNVVVWSAFQKEK